MGGPRQAPMGAGSCPDWSKWLPAAAALPHATTAAVKGPIAGSKKAAGKQCFRRPIGGSSWRR
ncbi:hypothetical protein GCM10009715_21370 [Paeniglutamicibacter psychrophenolicus]